METLPRETVIWGETTWAEKPVQGKLRHRLRPGGLGLFVGVIAGPHHRPGFDMAETEAESLVPQVDKFFRGVEAGNRQVIF
jgi:hypothetical protein